MTYSVNNLSSTLKYRLSQTSSLLYKFRYLLGSSFVFAVIIGVGYSSYRPLSSIQINEVRYETGSVDLALTPATLNIDANTEQIITLTANSGSSKVSAIVVELEYDLTTLTINSVTQGDFLSNSLSSAVIEGGKVKFTYAASPDSGGIEGSGTLATISITSTSTDSTLSFNTQTKAAIIGSSTNELHTALDSNIIINSTATPTPSPSPSPTATPSTQPSSSPSSNPSTTPSSSPSSTPPASFPTTSLSLKSDPTCTNISLLWDSVQNAPGYYLDLSKSDSFTDYDSSDKLSGSAASYTFSGLDHNTLYHARITLASIPDFPQFSPVFQVRTRDCSVGSSPTPTPTPSTTPTPTPTTQPSPTSSPSGNIITRLFKRSPSPSPSSTPTSKKLAQSSPTTQSNQPNYAGSLNDVFGNNPEGDSTSETDSINFFQRIILGWKAIFNKLTSIL